jgi:hypothetical protein
MVSSRQNLTNFNTFKSLLAFNPLYPLPSLKYLGSFSSY